MRGRADLCSLKALLVGTRRRRKEAMLLPWKAAWIKLHREALCLHPEHPCLSTVELSAWTRLSSGGSVQLPLSVPWEKK